MRNCHRLTALSAFFLALTAWVPAANSQGLPTGDAENPVTLQAQFTAAKGGQPARLFITATIQPGWHIYSITQPPGDLIKSEIKLSPSDKFKLLGDFTAYPAPKVEQQPEAFPGLDIETHENTVTWHAPIEFAPGVDPAKLQIEGTVFYQACATACLPPRDAKFTARLGQGVAVPAEQLALAPPAVSATPGKNDKHLDNKDAADSANPPSGKSPAAIGPNPTANSVNGKMHWRPFSLAAFERIVGPNFDLEHMKVGLKRQQTSGLGWQLLLGLLGGLILNIMPCVLPVIGLKILSFIEQGGKNRWHTFTLNLWYSAGLISVFLILASLAVFANLGWGRLFQFSAFNVALAVVVFVMGLSFLGVWEIPIPGFVGSGKSAEISAREGAAALSPRELLPPSSPRLAPGRSWPPPSLGPSRSHR